MELRQLKTFVVVAEELHFGRAALKLKIAQPAVTAQIQALEKEIGVQLLERTTRRVHLTEGGKVFYNQCLLILRDVDRSFAMTQAVTGKDLLKITIGTIHPATFGILPKFIARIKERYPDSLVHIHNGTTESIVREIEHGHVNLAFIRPIENIGALRWQAIKREKYLLAVSAGNPLSRKERISLRDLRGENIIALSQSKNSTTDRYFSDKLEQYGLAHQVAYTCNDTLAMVALAQAGVGVCFVPEWVTEIPGRNFELRSVEEVDLQIGLGLAWSADDPTANRDSIIELCRTLIDN